MAADDSKLSSKILCLNQVDFKDEFDEKFEKSYAYLIGIVSGLSERETHDALNSHVSKGAQQHEDICLGLLYSILSDPPSAAKSYRDLALVTRDVMNLVLTRLNQLLMERYTKLQPLCRQQVIWLTKELVRSNILGADSVCHSLMRNIQGGDISTNNILLAEQILDILIDERTWVEKNPTILALSVYTYLRLVVDHMPTHLSALRQKETEYCISMLREKFTDCLIIGRDLIRLLQNVARIPEFQTLWRDLLNSPQMFGEQFTGVAQLLMTRTPRRFLLSRLTPSMENKIAFLLSKVRFGQQKRYQDWFQKQFLSTPESQTLRFDLIRYICGVIHPTNEVLCSDIIPRWAVIGWLLTTSTSNVAASNAKLSLFYDWLFFQPNKDNIMNIEPAILVMYHSIKQHPTVTVTLLDFLCRIVSNYSIPLQDLVREGVRQSLRAILEKRVLQSLVPLFEYPKLDRELRATIRENFGEFCFASAEAASMTIAGNNEPLASPDSGLESDQTMSPRMAHAVVDDPDDSDLDDIMELGGGATTEPITARFSDDDDDLPLSVHTPPDEKPLEETELNEPKEPKKETRFKKDARDPLENMFRPIATAPNSINTSADLTDQLIQLQPEIQQFVKSLPAEKDNEMQCEIMEKMLEHIIQMDMFDESTAMSLAACLCALLKDMMMQPALPDDIGEESIADAIGKPLFVLFRNLCQIDDDNHRIQSLVSEMYSRVKSAGYLLVFYLTASKSDDDNFQYYTSISTEDLERRIVNDMRHCSDSDVRLLCYLAPTLYTQFQDECLGNCDLLRVYAESIDSSQLQDLIFQVMLGNLTMIDKDNVIDVIAQSLTWETFEQFCVWQLVAAHQIEIDYLLPLALKLRAKSHPEALSNLLLMLKAEKPSTDILKHIYSRSGTDTDRFSTSILHYWSKEYDMQLAENTKSLLLKFNTTPRRRQRIPGNKGPGLPTVQQILTHLNLLRQTCNYKKDTFFSQDATLESLYQVQLNSSDGIKTRFSDLFALCDDYTESSRKTRTARKLGNSTARVAKKTAAAVIEIISDSDSDDDDMIVIPAKKRKKANSSPNMSDSD